jgi:hypothetical protein
LRRQLFGRKGAIDEVQVVLTLGWPSTFIARGCRRGIASATASFHLFRYEYGLGVIVKRQGSEPHDADGGGWHARGRNARHERLLGFVP